MNERRTENTLDAVIKNNSLIYIPPISSEEQKQELESFPETQARRVLGGKGLSLADMRSLGLQVPDWFTISTEFFRRLSDHANECELSLPELKQSLYSIKTINEIIQQELTHAIIALEKRTQSTFEGTNNPLLVSVRSGAPTSMPGMMSTILNVGMNDTVVRILAEKYNSQDALQLYEFFIQQFSGIALKLPNNAQKFRYNSQKSFDANLAALKEEYRDIIPKIPTHHADQILHALAGVIHSWYEKPAVTFRQIYHLENMCGTAVTIQQMVYGNFSYRAGTGIVHTRRPLSGRNAVSGNYLPHAQGEQLVSGKTVPKELSYLHEHQEARYSLIIGGAKRIERKDKRATEVEFTIDDKGEVYFLQKRGEKVGEHASIQIARDLYEEGITTAPEALLLMQAQGMTPQTILKKRDSIILTKGTPIVDQVGYGRLAFSYEKTHEFSNAGEPVVFCTQKPKNEDIEILPLLAGYITHGGGSVSHPIVIARAMKIPTVTGSEMTIDGILVQFEKEKAQEGDYVTVYGPEGLVLQGKANISSNKNIAPYKIDAKRKIIDPLMRQAGIKPLLLVSMFDDIETILKNELVGDLPIAINSEFELYANQKYNILEIMAGCPTTSRAYQETLEFLTEGYRKIKRALARAERTDVGYLCLEIDTARLLDQRDTELLKEVFRKNKKTNISLKQDPQIARTILARKLETQEFSQPYELHAKAIRNAGIANQKKMNRRRVYHFADNQEQIRTIKAAYQTIPNTEIKAITPERLIITNYITAYTTIVQRLQEIHHAS